VCIASTDGEHADELSLLLEQTLRNAVNQLTYASSMHTGSNKMKKPRKRARTVEAVSQAHDTSDTTQELQHAAVVQLAAKSVLPQLIAEHATVLIRLGR
jgi:dTDP-D-glucose 4,6-dehydratase